MLTLNKLPDGLLAYSFGYSPSVRTIFSAFQHCTHGICSIRIQLGYVLVSPNSVVEAQIVTGPCAWILVAEIWPLSIRGKGVSIAASSNWVRPLDARAFVSKF